MKFKYLVNLTLVSLLAQSAYAGCDAWQGFSNILDRLDVGGLCVVTGHPQDSDILYRSELPKARFWVTQDCTQKNLTSDFQLALFLSPSDFELQTETQEARDELRHRFNADLLKIMTDDAWHWCRWLKESNW